MWLDGTEISFLWVISMIVFKSFQSFIWTKTLHLPELYLETISFHKNLIKNKTFLIILTCLFHFDTFSDVLLNYEKYQQVILL